MTDFFAKQASLDKALGSLYLRYGPPLEKHAALRFFGYSLDKDRLDEEALGVPFCKLARASRTDPWVMAQRVVQGYPTLMKSASSLGVKELAQFYDSWAGNMIKKANVLTGIGNIARKGKAVGDALVGSRGALRSSKHFAEKGLLKSEMGAGRAAKRALKRQNALQEMGGGSVARGQKIHAQNAAERAARPVRSAPKPSEAATAVQPKPTAGAPEAATAVQPRPSGSTAVTQPAARTTQATKPSALSENANTVATSVGPTAGQNAATGAQPTPQNMNYLQGAALLGGFGLGAGALTGDPSAQMAQAAYGY